MPRARSSGLDEARAIAQRLDRPSTAVADEVVPGSVGLPLPGLDVRTFGQGFGGSLGASIGAHGTTLARLAYPAELFFVVARDLSIPLLDQQRWRRSVTLPRWMFRSAR